MKNFYVLTTALEYIEDNICEPFTLEMVANECATSLSGLHKLFSYAFRYSLKEYIQKRRHSLACYDLLNTNLSIIDIAVKYGFNSHEVFTRSFVKLRGQTPSEFRNGKRLTNLFPKLELNIKGDTNRMKKVDIKDLYEEIQALRQSYVLCFDAMRFNEINRTYGHDVGDVVLAKMADRVISFLDDNMLFFRIGGDEFACIPGYFDKEDAVSLAEKITKLNGEEVLIGDIKVPLNMRIGITKIPQKGIKYGDIIDNMQSAIDRARENNVRFYLSE